MINISNIFTKKSPVILLVAVSQDKLLGLGDVLEESGFSLLWADNAVSAIAEAQKQSPCVILLDVCLPELDGIGLCEQLKSELATQHIPVIFMTGDNKPESVSHAFDAGCSDYMIKPVHSHEIIARIQVHLRSANMMQQAKVALDVFGQAACAIVPQSGKVVWQTPLATELLKSYFSLPPGQAIAPSSVLHWIAHGQYQEPLVINRDNKRLTLRMTSSVDDEQWLILLNETVDATSTEILMRTFGLTPRQSEVLFWIVKGKTTRDIGEILGNSPRTINKHLEHVFIKLGVENRTAAAALVSNSSKGF